MSKLKRWFRRQWPRSPFVKVPRYTKAQERQLLRSLAQHPGWEMLMAGLNNQKAGLEQIQAGATHAADITGLDGLIRYQIEAAVREEGIYRLGQIQDIIRRAEAFPEMEPAPQPDRV